jgi:hypothetical protein
VKHKTLKPSEENMGQHIQGQGLGEGLLDMRPKAQFTKKKSIHCMSPKFKTLGLQDSIRKEKMS